MAISIGLVVLVVFLFLRHAAATLIPSVAIPVSLLSTCAVMYLLGYTIDNVSLMALTIAVGFIIDDAIVMVENVIRHVEAGEQPLAAAFAGSREIVFTIMSMTLSLVAVFIPLLFMGGLLGRLFREFAVTISVALLMSALVSLTLTPMMCGRLRHRRQREPRIFAAGARRPLSAGASFLFCRAAVGAPPSADHARNHGRDAGGDGVSLCDYPEGVFSAAGQRTDRRHDGSGAGHLLCRDGRAPACARSGHHGRSGCRNSVLLGRQQPGAQYRPDHDRSEADRRAQFQRDRSLGQIAQGRCSVPGIALFGQARQDVQIGAKVSKTQYQYTLQDPDVGNCSNGRRSCSSASPRSRSFRM